jgi:putative two-component system response regulator
MKVLIADDDAITREMLTHVLTAEGYDVLTAVDGTEALDIIRRGECHLVVSDREMPNMDGLDLCRAIRSEQLAHYVYVILLTRFGEPQDVLAGLSAGADDYVTKPFESAELRMRIRTGERILALESRDVTIFVLAKLAESRDPGTGAHLERVRCYARALAERLSVIPKFQREVDGAFMQRLYQTSPLHDIGKVAIPDAILLKPGRLDERETEIMRTHTLRGAETLDAALQLYPQAGFLLMARDIAISHHEWYDGTGYPFGLSGDDIPLCGRIVALADVYDALTSKRVYKEAMSHEVSRSIIVEHEGTQFDPNVVAAFLAEKDSFVDVRRQHPDVTPVDPYKNEAA